MAAIKSIEEKAKAYDKAIKRVEDIEAGKCQKPFMFTEGLFDYIFPELKESENERIRACIGMCLTDIDEQRFADFNTSLKECSDWLKKQGEQNPQGKTALEAINEEKVDNANKVEPRQEKLTDFERTLADICIGWIGEEPGWEQYIKDNADVLLKNAIKMFNSVQDADFEQEPAWSEEDETNLRRTEYAVMKFFGGDCSLVDWLRKSLKDRYTWKPSDEQLKAQKGE